MARKRAADDRRPGRIGAALLRPPPERRLGRRRAEGVRVAGAPDGS